MILHVPHLFLRPQGQAAVIRAVYFRPVPFEIASRLQSTTIILNNMPPTLPQREFRKNTLS